jgi:hypothetical protein|tara:strand:- start:3539 stop:3856 length:318 start_codon:yes stop_codon:yes gene_type:complete
MMEVSNPPEYARTTFLTSPDGPTLFPAIGTNFFEALFLILLFVVVLYTAEVVAAVFDDIVDALFFATTILLFLERDDKDTPDEETSKADFKECVEKDIYRVPLEV